MHGLQLKYVRADSMIDFGFVISAFVPLVLYWMYAVCLFVLIMHVLIRLH